MEAQLPTARDVLVVCAHPDDESFGLGSIIGAYVEAGTDVRVLCFTQGEASTLGAHHNDLAEVRSQEFQCASAALGIRNSRLLDYPDGRLTDTPLESLLAHIDDAAHTTDLLLVFDEHGITGHPDHCAATKAATAWARANDVPVLAWVLPHDTAEALNTTLGTAFLGRRHDEIDFTLTLDRTRQLEAIACHSSQATDNPVLWRRLALQGNHEHLRLATR